jgi:predicted nucleotidyltransferase
VLIAALVLTRISAANRNINCRGIFPVYTCCAHLEILQKPRNYSIPEEDEILAGKYIAKKKHSIKQIRGKNSEREGTKANPEDLNDIELLLKEFLSSTIVSVLP